MGFAEFLKARGDQFNQFRQSPQLGYGMDLAGGAVTAAALQQGANALLPGNDPNPFLTAAVAAPVLGALGNPMRRSLYTPANELPGAVISNGQLNAFAASGLGLAAGGAVNSSNVVTGGNDMDTNSIAPYIALAAMAPTAYNMLRRTRRDIPDVTSALQ
jgi:hypothetical protein